MTNEQNLSSLISVIQERHHLASSPVPPVQIAALQMAMAALELARKCAQPDVAEKLIEQGQAAMWLCYR
jgi:hypothetical protein